MLILALDTTMAACSAAIVDTDRAAPLASAFAAMERGHAETLAPMVAQMLADAALVFADIDRIAVTVGPGSFTGVRIGLAMARGLGLARGIPVIGIDTLSAIAANEVAAVPLHVISDARNGQVYAGAFGPSRDVTVAPHLAPTAEAASVIPSGALILGTGCAAILAASERKDLVLSEAGDLPVAAHFARLAAGRCGGVMPNPLYLRAPDARPQGGLVRKTAPFTLKPANGESAQLLSLLHAEAFGEGWTEQAFRDLFAAPGIAATIATEQDEPVGFILIRTAADEAEIITIGTRPDSRRRGVARLLLDRQCAELGRRGIRHMFLEVAASNAAAAGLYSALGFNEVGRRKGYYQRAYGHEDAIVMRRELGS